MMSVGGVAKFDCLNLSQDCCEVQRVRWASGKPSPRTPSLVLIWNGRCNTPVGKFQDIPVESRSASDVRHGGNESQ